MNNPFELVPGSPYEKLLKKRKKKEAMFRIYGLSAVIFAFMFLSILIFSIFDKGMSAFYQTKIRLNITFEENLVDPERKKNPDDILYIDFSTIIQKSLKDKFPEIADENDMALLYSLFSRQAEIEVRDALLKDLSLIGRSKEIWLTASADFDMHMKNKVPSSLPEEMRKIKDKQLIWMDQLKKEESIKFRFNKYFFVNGDSREPEQAGVLGSIIGSFLSIMCCLILAFPLGVLTAVYLEEFAPKNLITDIIEVNINNLAAVPSIVFGLLGLSIYINVIGLPRSSSLVGGLTLALLILPVIVITTRNSIKSIPPSIKEAATALGASKVQVIMHHILPLSMPGIMTGTILSIARALGETAPLLMIGMVAFVADIPHNFLDPASALPVQVFLWSDSPEIAFAEKTSGAIIVLLLFLITANALAVYLRKKFEVKW